ncbi:DUF1080 domain-containing protein [bacterium]|nr:DUF1080 domain-containing protein [bacterium]
MFEPARSSDGSACTSVLAAAYGRQNRPGARQLRRLSPGPPQVQVLDSHGIAPADNPCGGIYKVATPEASASLPPEQWQNYDIFTPRPR